MTCCLPLKESSLRGSMSIETWKAFSRLVQRSDRGQRERWKRTAAGSQSLLQFCRENPTDVPAAG